MPAIDNAAALLLLHLLQDLNFNFQTVILPEALTAFQAEEPSVLSIVNDLEGLISWVGCPLDNIIETLEQLVVNATSLGGTAITVSVCNLYRYYVLLLDLNTYRVWERLCL